MFNCIAESNTNVGFIGGNGGKLIFNPSTYNNSAATSGTIAIGGIAYTPSASVFVSPPSNLALNSTAGASSLKASSYPSVWPRGTSTTYLDIGALQHQNPAVAQTGYAH